MDSVWTWFKVNILSWLTPPKTIEVIDVIQIIIIAYFIYYVITWLKNTRAYALLKGLFVVLVFVVLVNIFQMDTIIWLLQNLGVVAFTALFIIFQPEIRRGLEQMGHRNPISSLFSLNRFTDGQPKRFSDRTLGEIVRAAYEMGEVKTGALIIVEKEMSLGEFTQTGIDLDATVSSQLLINIFEYNTPLHDGAVIIRGDRILAATCYLPLSENMSLSKTLGTRHRAGLGITEVSDCFAIIVSEETGKVSYAYEGKLVTDVGMSELREEFTFIQKFKGSRNSLFRRREDD